MVRWSRFCLTMRGYCTSIRGAPPLWLTISSSTGVLIRARCAVRFPPVGCFLTTAIAVLGSLKVTSAAWVNCLVADRDSAVGGFEKSAASLM